MRIFAAVCLAGMCACRPRGAPAPAAMPAGPAEVPAASEPEPVPEPEPEGPDLGVREVDWANFDYDGFVALIDGRGSMHEYMEDYEGLHDITDWTLRTVEYGDLDADGSEDAVVVLDEAYWAPGGVAHQSTRLYVYRGHPLQRLAAESVIPTKTLRLEGTTVQLESIHGERLRLRLRGDRLLPED